MNKKRNTEKNLQQERSYLQSTHKKLEISLKSFFHYFSVNYERYKKYEFCMKTLYIWEILKKTIEIMLKIVTHVLAKQWEEQVSESLPTKLSHTLGLVSQHEFYCPPSSNLLPVHGQDAVPIPTLFICSGSGYYSRKQRKHPPCTLCPRCTKDQARCQKLSS